MTRRVRVGWSAPDGAPVDGYLLERFVLPTGPWEEVRRTESTEVVLEDLADNETVLFRVSAIVGGIVEGQPEDDEYDATFSPGEPTLATPPTLTGFTATQVGDLVECSWEALEDLTNLDLVEIREGATWSGGIVRARVAAAETAARFGWFTADLEAKYKAAVLNLQGFYGAAVGFDLTLERDELAVEQTEGDESGGSWPGTLDGTENSGGLLGPASTVALGSTFTNLGETYNYLFGGPYRVEPTTYTADPYDAGFVIRQRLEVDVTGTLAGATPLGSAYRGIPRPSFDGAGANLPIGTRHPIDRVSADFRPKFGLGLELQIRVATNDSASPTWGAWRRWTPDAWYRARHVQLRAVFSDPMGFFRPLLSVLKWRVYFRNWKQEGRETYGGTGTTTVTFAKPFHVAPEVGAIAITTSDLNVTVSNISTTGFEFTVHGGTSEDVSWRAMGV